MEPAIEMVDQQKKEEGKEGEENKEDGKEKPVTQTLFGDRVQDDTRRSWHLNIRD